MDPLFILGVFLLVLLYVGLVKAHRGARERWEAEHLKRCAGCGRVVYPE